MSPADRITIVKANGERETFEPEKLRESLLHSGASEEAVEDVLSHLLPELHDDMTTGEIYRH
ncbi:MAG: ATPase, partial [Minisyncoccia bacterium]